MRFLRVLQEISLVFGDLVWFYQGFPQPQFFRKSGLLEAQTYRPRTIFGIACPLALETQFRLTVSIQYIHLKRFRDAARKAMENDAWPWSLQASWVV